MVDERAERLARSPEEDVFDVPLRRRAWKPNVQLSRRDEEFAELEARVERVERERDEARALALEEAAKIVDPIEPLCPCNACQRARMLALRIRERAALAGGGTPPPAPTEADEIHAQECSDAH